MCFIFIQKHRAAISGREFTVFTSVSSRITYSQLRLHVIVKFMSGVPTFSEIPIVSWSFCCINLSLPTNMEGKKINVRALTELTSSTN